jgi:hypothetical protein
MVIYHKLNSGTGRPKLSEQNKWKCTKNLRNSTKAERPNPENKLFKKQTKMIRNSVSRNLMAVIELSFLKRLNVKRYLEYSLLFNSTDEEFYSNEGNLSFRLLNFEAGEVYKIYLIRIENKSAISR